MGNSIIWWYPGGQGPLQEIDLGEALSDVQPVAVHSGVSSEAADGSLRRMTLGGWLTVRLVLSNFDDAALARKLLSLETHLKKGFPISVALDEDTAWAGILAAPPAQGDTTVTTRAGNEFAVYTGSSAALVSGDEVRISSGAPEVWREYFAVDSVSGTSVTLAESVRYPHSVGPVVLAARDFFPVLVYDGPPDRPIVSDDYRRVYTLDLPLREDVAAYAALAETDPTALGDTSGIGVTLSGLVNLGGAAGGGAFRVGMDR